MADAAASHGFAPYGKPFRPKIRHFLGSEERSLFKAAQLAAVNPLDRHIAQPFHRADADLQMTRNLRLVELARHAGQLQLSM